jgi:hypothetical protein
LLGHLPEEGGFFFEFVAKYAALEYLPNLTQAAESWGIIEMYEFR